MSDNSCTDKENNNRKLLEYARNGYFDSFRGILDSQLDCDVNCIDDLRKSPLHWVCTGGNLDFLKFLIAKNADVHAKDERGWTPLAIACFSKHSSQLRYLLREARANINCGDGNGVTPLQRASSHGHKDIVDILLNLGKLSDPVLEVNAQCNLKKTALYYAVEHKHCDRAKKEIVEGLLEANADVTIEDKDKEDEDKEGKTPLDICEDIDILKCLLGRKGELILPCQSGNINAVHELIKQGSGIIDVNFTGMHRLTPLHWTCKASGSSGIIVSIKDILKCSRLGGKSASLFEIACLLLDNGAVVDRSCAKGRHPLHYACYNGHEKIALELIRRGANVHHRDKYGKTPLNVCKTNTFQQLLQTAYTSSEHLRNSLKKQDDETQALLTRSTEDINNARIQKANTAQQLIDAANDLVQARIKSQENAALRETVTENLNKTIELSREAQAAVRQAEQEKLRADAIVCNSKNAVEAARLATAEADSAVERARLLKTAADESARQAQADILASKATVAKAAQDKLAAKNDEERAAAIKNAASASREAAAADLAIGIALREQAAADKVALKALADKTAAERASTLHARENAAAEHQAALASERQAEALRVEATRLEAEALANRREATLLAEKATEDEENARRNRENAAEEHREVLAIRTQVAEERAEYEAALLAVREAHEAALNAANQAARAAQAAAANAAECCVCLEDKRLVAFVPCGHQCVCAEDAAVIMAANRKCPKCRVDATSIINVFI